MLYCVQQPCIIRCPTPEHIFLCSALLCCMVHLRPGYSAETQAESGMTNSSAQREQTLPLRAARLSHRPGPEVLGEGWEECAPCAHAHGKILQQDHLRPTRTPPTTTTTPRPASSASTQPLTSASALGG